CFASSASRSHVRGRRSIAVLFRSQAHRRLAENSSRKARAARSARSRQSLDRRLQLESLETRIALSASATTTTVNAQPATSGFGQQDPFTALVASADPGNLSTPTGSVRFSEGSKTLATVPLDASGNAKFVTSSLSVGAHTITANYLGSAAFATSNG